MYIAHLRLIRHHVPETLVVHQPDEDVGVHHRTRDPAVQRLGPVVGVPVVSCREARPRAKHEAQSREAPTNNNRMASGPSPEKNCVCAAATEHP